MAFLPLTPAGVDRALGMMARLYSASMRFDPVHARAAIKGLIANDACGAAWIIQAAGQTAGYLVLTIGYSLEFHGRYGLLDELFVEEAFRGEGIGTAALAFAEEVCRLRGLQALRLEVTRANQRAQALYRRAGFQAHDRDLMTKWL
ncbi:MAG: GNAT family N-acetyltransferase [Bryobacteraceae bacterium]